MLLRTSKVSPSMARRFGLSLPAGARGLAAKGSKTPPAMLVLGAGSGGQEGWKTKSGRFGISLYTLGGAGGLALLCSAHRAASPPVQAEEKKVPQPIDAICMACDDAGCNFTPRRFQRRPLGPKDVLIDMKYCGVCHSDLTLASNHFYVTRYPLTPGHELAGVCIAVGPEVTKFKVGDKVGVGCLVDSCGSCKACKRDSQQWCLRMVLTYGWWDMNGRAKTYPEGGTTIGGYSSKMVVDENFGIMIPKSYPLECAGPIMCAGVTMYEPLKVNGAKEGTKVGIVGLGGLGMLGVKLAKVMGCEVTAISRGRGKEEAVRRMGADHFLATGEGTSAEEGSLDLIINTIPSDHDWTVYHRLLNKKGKQVLLGLHASAFGALTAGLVRSPSLEWSYIGGIKQTQEVVDLCSKENIRPELEIVPVQKLNEVFSALAASNDSGKRYVLDLQGSLNESVFDNYNALPPDVGHDTSAMSYLTMLKEAGRILFFY